MAFNRYLDRKFDALNPRTAIREIPKGMITPGNELAFTILSCILFITTTYFINRICFFLSPVALAVVLGYSYTKRFTPLCHLILGLGLSLAPIGAYLAVTGKFHLLPLLFSFAVLFVASFIAIYYAGMFYLHNATGKPYSEINFTANKYHAIVDGLFVSFMLFGIVAGIETDSKIENTYLVTENSFLLIVFA